MPPQLDLFVYFPKDALRSDLSYCGILCAETAGENLAFGDVCYEGNDDKYYKADADAESTMPVEAIALETISVDSEGLFLLWGLVRNDSWSWTKGGLVYASTTAGALTQTAPSGSGDQVQVVGVAFRAHILFFKPGYELVEIA